MNRLFFYTFLLLSAASFAEFKVEMHGYVKLDLEYNDTNTGGTPSPAPTQIPLNSFKANQHGEFIVDARESRFNIKATDEYFNTKLTGYVEADFFTVTSTALVNNSWNLRLREAYMKGELPTGLFILAGQNWSLFMNSDIGQPNLIDFQGPVGALFARQPQLRVGYIKHLSQERGDLKFEFDVEKQSFPTLGCVNDSNVVNTAQGSGQLLPLFVGKISYLSKLFQIEWGGTVSKSYVEPDPTCFSGKELQRTVWALESSAQFNYKKMILFGTIHHLNGLNRLEGGNYAFDLVLNTAGNLIPIHSNGWYVGGAWIFSPELSINTVYGWEKAVSVPNSPFSGPTFAKYWSYHLNFLYLFWRRWQTGLEYVHFSARTFSHQNGHVDEVRTCLWYFF